MSREVIKETHPSILIWMADAMQAKAGEISRAHEFATERVLTLQDLEGIFREAAKRERRNHY